MARRDMRHLVSMDHFHDFYTFEIPSLPESFNRARVDVESPCFMNKVDNGKSRAER